MNDRVVISGCSGGGKSTLMAELARRGFRTVAEPGRRVIMEERASGGDGLPWIDLAAFARRAARRAVEDFRSVERASETVFFDRSLIDALPALGYGPGSANEAPIVRGIRYCSLVFFAPPWREIYRHDEERRHDFAAAVAEHSKLLSVYSALGYQTDLLPKLPVSQRADYLLAKLDAWRAQTPKSPRGSA